MEPGRTDEVRETSRFVTDVRCPQTRPALTIRALPRGKGNYMKATITLLAALPLLATLALAGPVSAETLLIERVQEENSAALPARGQSMAQVEARHGAPAQRMDPRGGQKSQWPTINRWVYPAFTVYFENTRVIDVVANKADATEIGPKPPIL